MDIPRTLPTPGGAGPVTGWRPRERRAYKGQRAYLDGESTVVAGSRTGVRLWVGSG